MGQPDELIDPENAQHIGDGIVSLDVRLKGLLSDTLEGTKLVFLSRTALLLTSQVPYSYILLKCAQESSRG